MIYRAGAAGVAAACGGLAAWLAWHHPLSPVVAVTAVSVLCALTLLRPAAWPLWLLPLLPIAGLMPWSGWVTVEELDLMVLAIAAGGWARLSTGWASPGAGGRPKPLQGWMMFALPLLVSTIFSLQRGVEDAGGWSWGWWQGYQEPLNSVRLAKPIVEVALLMPLWLAATRADARQAQACFKRGMLGLLLTVALAVLWERLAFTGLADFSTDYRATGLFWEMHLGGAALDAALALSLPFAVAVLADARRLAGWVATAAVLLLGLYAGLVTFSRIVYAALPVGVMVFALLRTLHAPERDDRARGRGRGRWQPALASAGWIAGFAVLALWGFPSSGYRGLLALLGCAALLLPLGSALVRLRPHALTLSVAGAAMAGVVAICLVAVLAKGAYIAFALCWMLAAVGLAWGRQRAEDWPAVAAIAGFGGTVVALIGVGVHWSGTASAPSIAAALALAATAVAARLRRQPIWPVSLRWQIQMLGILIAVAALCGVFGGGAYMSQRLNDSSRDSQDRMNHWQHALSLLRGSDWLVGKGLGRFWASQVLSARPQDHTGEHRLLPPGNGRPSAAVVLTSGTHDLGSAEALLLSQRVSAPASGAVTLRLLARTRMPVRLDASLCSKHLLYAHSCQGEQIDVPDTGNVWQPVQMRFRGAALAPGPWYAPRLTVFSVNLGRHANRIEMDDMHLIDANGRELLTNGDFEQGLAHWFFTSDRYHLPWHAKNLAVHLLFEQGWFGLLAFGLVAAAALWRTAFGAARRHPLAPALAAAIVGLLTVGLVDSILDMPRIAFLTLLVLVVALSLPADEGGWGARRVPPRAP